MSCARNTVLIPWHRGTVLPNQAPSYEDVTFCLVKHYAVTVWGTADGVLTPQSVKLCTRWKCDLIPVFIKCALSYQR